MILWLFEKGFGATILVVIVEVHGSKMPRWHSELPDCPPLAQLQREGPLPGSGLPFILCYYLVVNAASHLS